LLLWIISGWRHANDTSRWQFLDSVSAYYHTGAVAVFIGILAALAAFLMSYRGYDNEHRRRDRIMAIVASIAAVGVAFFPTAAPQGFPEPSWWTAPMRTLHYACAVMLFCSFAVFCLFLFPKTDPKSGGPPTEGKRARNRVYFSCGAAILLCMVWAAFTRKSSIFVPESLALICFAVSWLVKGRVLWTWKAAGARTLHHGRNPRRLADDTWKAMRF
ncbi:MAG TPA: hypothetical protein VM509_16310, partial [Planctomycetota bacterium]|nr:hypothetical protein [Planctomycetota bacterium]